MSIKLSDQHVPVAKMRPREYIKIRGAAEHNLKISMWISREMNWSF